MIWELLLAGLAVAALFFFGGFKAGWEGGYHQHALDTDPDYRRRYDEWRVKLQEYRRDHSFPYRVVFRVEKKR